ncbi:MAG TPA: hypothetical protein VFH27_05985, partial [Longimicrobiaceae bacterium]|nr:hypothetical protein [Longimicrobiaceae bacterium]
GGGVPALATLNAGAVAELRTDGWSEERLKRAFDGSFMWHDTNPLAQRLWTWRNILQHTWREYKAAVVKKWRDSGLQVWGSRYRVRQVKRQGLGLERMISVEISLEEGEKLTKTIVRG